MEVSLAQRTQIWTDLLFRAYEMWELLGGLTDEDTPDELQLLAYMHLMELSDEARKQFQGEIVW